MKFFFAVILVSLLTSGCAHTNSPRDPQAIPGETFSAGGIARIPNDPYLDGQRIDGVYICFHKAVTVKPGSNPTVYKPTSASLPANVKNASCGFYTDGNNVVVIKAGTMVKATDGGSSMLSWGGVRDHSDKFPQDMSVSCSYQGQKFNYATQSYQTAMSIEEVNSYFAQAMTMTNNDKFKCDAIP